MGGHPHQTLGCTKHSAAGRSVGRVVVNGKRLEVSAKTTTEATKKLKAIRTGADAGRPIAPGDLTVAKLLEQWAAKALPNRHLEGSTLTVHRASIRALTDELGTRPVRTLTAEQIEDALEHRAAAGRSKRTVASYRTTLAMALDWAERRGIVPRNVARVVELPQGEGRQGGRPHLISVRWSPMRTDGPPLGGDDRTETSTPQRRITMTAGREVEARVAQAMAAGQAASAAHVQWGEAMHSSTGGSQVAIEQPATPDDLGVPWFGTPRPTPSTSPAAYAPHGHRVLAAAAIRA